MIFFLFPFFFGSTFSSAHRSSRTKTLELRPRRHLVDSYPSSYQSILFTNPTGGNTQNTLHVLFIVYLKAYLIEFHNEWTSETIIVSKKLTRYIYFVFFLQTDYMIIHPIIGGHCDNNLSIKKPSVRFEHYCSN